MAEEKEKAAGDTNTNGLMTPTTKRPNEKKSDEIIPQYVAPVKKSRRKLLSEPKFIELAKKWHNNEIRLPEAAAILNVSWSTFQKNATVLLGKKQGKMRPARRAEPICVSLKASAEYQDLQRRSPRHRKSEEVESKYICPYVKPKEKLTCFNCNKEYLPEPMRYSHFYKDARRYFCSWTCKCRWLRSMGIEF